MFFCEFYEIFSEKLFGGIWRDSEFDDLVDILELSIIISASYQGGHWGQNSEGSRLVAGLESAVAARIAAATRISRS